MWPVCFSLLIVDVVATVLPPCRTSSLFNPKPVQSAAKKANCVTGITDVTVSANNTKILYSGPADNMAATELFVEIDQINSTVLTTINGGNTLIHGTYSIYSKLCFPANIAPTEEVETIQFLTHGGTLDNTYWDLAPGYSYVDAAADAGYATFSYDRLGTGKSDHPDPIQVVQLPLQVEIAHALVQMLRTTHIAGHRFKKVVGVGHSLGSGLSQGVTTAYPNDFDAVILTGTSASFAFAPLGTASTAQQIANTDPSGRFANLANGYVVPAPVPQSIQFAFYRYPHFDPRIFRAQIANVQTNALGELFTLGNVYTPSPDFTGPVDVVLGQNDFFYCGGNCLYPGNQAVPVLNLFYPAASNSSQTYLVPNSGHSINAHYSAPKAFHQMLSFIKTNGFH